jgi:amino acid transporter
MSLKELLFGKPLRTQEEQVEQIGPLSGVPVLGLDALASASYGPEAALTVLLSVGAISSSYMAPITGCVLLVLLAVFFSYRQTIAAYPQGGGSFVVAKDNLGAYAGLLAASALSIDYVLNVAVAISAGVGALVSAVPVLLPYTLWLCLGILCLLSIVNLRGLRSAGLLFMLPTYLFVACLATTIVIGMIKLVLGHGHPTPAAALPRVGSATAAASTWLLLRAFASGCTALTGVEAVADAVPVFRQPAVPLARRTLGIIVAILAFLLAGIALVAHGYGIMATPPGQPGYQSVLSQIVSVVVGRGAFYFIAMASILAVLALSANTSFADFPRVCRLLALDEYLPAEFAHRGGRLVYSTGIVVLTVLSGLLLVLFGGVTDRLIPLFAIGAFLAFTLSQLGMVLHWRQRRERHARKFMVINGIGALATGSTLVVIAISKFTAGAWMTLLVIPPLIFLFLRIRRYHGNLESETDEDGPLEIRNLSQPLIVIPLKRLDRVARKALMWALSMSSEIRVVQILAEEMRTEDLTNCWQELVVNPIREAGHKPPQLVVLPSAYREFYGPLFKYLRKIGRENPDRPVAIMLPEIVERRWYHFLIRHRTTFLKGLLLLHGGPQMMVISTPWYPNGALRPEHRLGSRRAVAALRLRKRRTASAHG